MAKKAHTTARLKEAVIAGVYQTIQARTLGRGIPDLYVEAVKGALDDAGMNIHEVDGMVGTNPLLIEREALNHPAAVFAEYFGTHMRYSEQSQAGTQAETLGLLHAVEAIALGRAHTVVVARAASRQFGSGGPGRDSGQQVDEDEWFSLIGLPRVAVHGMIAHRHMHEYVTTAVHSSLHKQQFWQKTRRKSLLP